MEKLRLPRQNSGKSPKVEKPSEEELKRIIRNIHLKVTPQRLAILEVLMMGRRHFTTQEIFEIIVKKHPEIGFATVYRFLKTLTEHNFVTEVRMGGLAARYEMTPRHHHDHMSCVSCGLIVEFENYEIELLQEKVAQKLGFSLTGHVLELFGKCPSCKSKDL